MDYIARYKHWIDSDKIDEATRNELLALEGNDKEIKERFYKQIEFGTAGMRGLLGAGRNRMNKYTVRKATQGYSVYVKEHGEEACKKGVVIAHDNRRMSVEFAKETAGVLAANGIRSYLFDSLRPTPELSFAVRELNAFGGVMITASHNPPEYNGYKLYDNRGCQLIPSMTDDVIKHVTAIKDPLSVKTMDFSEAKEFVTILDNSIDEKYYAAVESIVLDPNLKKDIKII